MKRAFWLTGAIALSLLWRPASAQLKEFRVTPYDQPPAIPLVQANTQFPDNALILVYSSLPGLDFRSSMNAINNVTWNPVANRYQILVSPVKQILFVFGNGFIEKDIATISPQPKEVLYYKVEESISTQTIDKATFKITSDPPGATILINDIETAYRTPANRELPAGQLHIALRLPDYLEADTIIRCAPAERINLFIRLKPSWADVTIKVAPSDAQVIMDGKAVSAASVSLIPLTGPAMGLKPGVHELVVSRDRHKTQTFRFSVSSGEKKDFDIKLETVTGRLMVNTDPAGAMVQLNGRLEGSTPFDRSLPVGQYLINIRMDGHMDVSKTVTVSENSFITVNETLRNYSKVIRPLQSKSRFFTVLGLVGLGGGAYLWNSAKVNFDAYQSATTNAASLREKVEFADRVYPAALAAGALSMISAIHYGGRVRKSKREWGLVATPLIGGFGLAFHHRLGSSAETVK